MASLFNIVMVNGIAFFFTFFFIFEFLEGTGGLTPEGEVWQFIVFGGGEDKVGRDEDVLVLQVLLAADDRDDDLVGHRHQYN